MTIKIHKNIIKKTVNLCGYDIRKKQKITPDINSDKKFLKLYKLCKNFTMTSKERMYALYKSVNYIIQSKIPGDFVECGVWKGGSTMLIAFILREMNIKDRKIYLYDTFEGMTKPKKYDYPHLGNNYYAYKKWKKNQAKSCNEWCYAPLTEVKKNMSLTKYPKNNIIYVKGKVEHTIPKKIPKKISLLRLDTDWYESTKHELVYLYPNLLLSGVLIIDDYGKWMGSKKAVDEYFNDDCILLNRIDNCGRIGVKTK